LQIRGEKEKEGGEKSEKTGEKLSRTMTGGGKGLEKLLDGGLIICPRGKKMVCDKRR